MELGTFVPLCTAAVASGERDLRLRGAGIDVLEGARHVARKVVLFAVLQPEDDEDLGAEGAERGLYISAKSINVQEQDAAVLALRLRGVDLQREPYWGSLVLVLASHVFVATPGPLTTTSFQRLACLSDLLQWTMLSQADDGSGGSSNATWVKELLPRLTWLPLDLKIKDMEGLETPTKYLEYKLTNPPLHAVDVEAQMLVSGFFADRDCLVIKSATLSCLDGETRPHVLSSSKILTHALDRVTPKAFFGRYLSGGVLLHVLRSLAHAISAQSPIVLQRIIQNVQLNYWQLLLESALEKYSDLVHARLAVYERVEFTADYLVDITERKLKTERVAVVNAGQGDFSTFDEFGNLKRQATMAPNHPSGDVKSPSGADATLNPGLFTYLKDRAGRAFSKQFSKMSTASSSASTDASHNALGHIPEDEAADEEELQSFHESPEDALARYNAPIKAYEIPMQYIKLESESMPVSESTLEAVHREALNEVKSIILPFLYELRCTNVRFSEFVCTIDFLIGKRNLFRRIRRIKQRFELANQAASTVFCAQLVHYLHQIVLRKNESDNEVKKNSMPRINRSTSTYIVPEGDETNAVPLTKLPLEVLTYKNNLEAMISQYNFLARGPHAVRVLINYYQAVIRKRLLSLAQKEYNRFADACDVKETKLADLEDSLEETEKLVQRHQRSNEDFTVQEAKSIAEIEMMHKDDILKLKDAIGEANQMIEKALGDQQKLYQNTMQATRSTIDTIDQVAVKNRVFMGYLERYEKGHVFSKSWRQYFYVLDHATLKCYKSKSAYEERGPPCDPPIVLTGYSVVQSRTDEMKIKLVPPESGQMLRFRAPASVGRETWMKKLAEAAQLSGR